MRTALHALVALCLLGLGGLSVATTLYRWVDAQGVVHYSDTPHEGAQVIQISGAQTYHGTSAAPAEPGVTAAQQPGKKPEPYDSCAITVDGRQLQGAEGVQSFVIPEPERGDHSISAQVRSPEGVMLCNAPPVTFSVTKPSVNSPNNPVKPH